MKDIAILLPCWKSPELLKVCIPSLRSSIITDSEIVVILNEPDDESLSYLNEQGITTILSDMNLGPSAVDLAIPYMRSTGFKYVANVNSDMLFSYGWDKHLIDLLVERYPCTTSGCLVEPLESIHCIYENFEDFLAPGLNEIFHDNFMSGKYKTEVSISYNHPILCKYEDYINVHGYSNNMEQVWIDLKGKGLDDFFVYRLYHLHNKNFSYWKSDKAFIYHGVSLNSNKLSVRIPGHSVFFQKTGIAITDFRKIINYY